MKSYDGSILMIIIVVLIFCPPLGIALILGALAMVNRGVAVFLGIIAIAAIALISFLEIYILLIFPIPILIWCIFCFVINKKNKNK
jgi:predicted membrane protein